MTLLSLSQISLINAIAALLRFSASIILTNFLSPEVFGIYAMSITLLGYVGNSMSIGEAFLIAKSNKNEEQKTINQFFSYRLCVFLAWLLIFSLTVTFLTFTEGFKEPFLVMLVVYASLAYNGISTAYLQKIGKHLTIAKINLASVIIPSALAIFFCIFVSANIWALVIFVSFSHLTKFFLTELVNRELKPRYQRYWYRNMDWKYHANHTFVRGLETVRNSLDKFFIFYFIGASTLGLYDRAVTISGFFHLTLASTAGGILIQSLNSQSKIEKGISPAATIKLVIHVYIFGQLLLMLNAEDLFQILFNEQYRPAASLVPLIVPILLVNFIFLISQTIIWSIGAAKNLTLLSIIYLFLTSLALPSIFYKDLHTLLFTLNICSFAFLCVLLFDPILRKFFVSTFLISSFSITGVCAFFQQWLFAFGDFHLLPRLLFSCLISGLCFIGLSLVFLKKIHKDII